MAFYSYLMFGGNCREAMTRYQEVFGGELRIMRMGDAPGEGGGDVPAEQADLVMHAALELPGAILFASDDPTGGFTGAQGMNVGYSAPDTAEAERIFEALADGGEVTMPFSETFWTPGFGMCVDRFGTPWMIDVEHEPATTS